MIPFMKFRATKTNPSRKKAGERLPGAEGSQRGTGTLWRRRGAHHLDCCPGFAGVHSRENVSSVRLKRAPLIVRQLHFSTLSLTVRSVWRQLDFFHNWAQILFLGRSHGSYSRNVQVDSVQGVCAPESLRSLSSCSQHSCIRAMSPFGECP